MKKKAVTIYDIAERLNLSPSTVSRGLRDDHRINTNTKHLIHGMAATLNYKPNRAAAGLRGGSTATIGVIVPRISRNFFAKAISGIEKVARRHGYQVIITQSHETLATERENVAALMAARVDGIIASVAVESSTDSSHFEELFRHQFPLVFFDRTVGDFPVHRVVLDDFTSAHQAVTHLIAQGATRIAHLGGPDTVNVYHERHRGYVRALADGGLSLETAYVARDAIDEPSGRAAAARMLALAKPPDGFFAASDYAALGVVLCCREAALRIPEEVRVVSFANEPFTSIMEPGLSSVEQFSERMGGTAAELLFKQLTATEELRKEEIIIKGELQVRRSSS